MTPLRFPNARLYIHDLLARKDISGAQAIRKGAKEFGILGDEDQELSTDGKEISPLCDCCRAARSVLVQFFKQRNDASYQKDTELAWKSLTNRLNKYRRTSDQSEVLPLDCQLTCSKLAPVIFDLLLQEVHRY